MTRRRTGSCLGALALMGLVACGGSPRPALPRLPARAMDAWTEIEGLRVAAQPYPDPEQQRQLFQRELGPRYGLLPVFLVAENTGTETILLRTRWMALATGTGAALLASRSRETVDLAFGDEGLDWERAVGSAETLYHRRFDLGLSYLFGEALPSKVEAVHYASWQIPDERRLAPGERLRGFVYFDGPGRQPPDARGTLTVRFREAEGSPTARPSRSAVLPLGGPAPPGRP